MSSSEEMIIYLSKVKIVLLIFGSILFVALGAWILSLYTQSIEGSRRLNSPFLVFSIGLAIIIFFAACGLFGVKKFFDKTPGLILNTKGIIDNSSGVAAGFIPWSEVVGIRQCKVQQQKFVSIIVQDPEKYVDRGNAVKRMANRANLRMCGTPINISSSALKIGYEELLENINEYYSNRKNND